MIAKIRHKNMFSQETVLRNGGKFGTKQGNVRPSFGGVMLKICNFFCNSGIISSKETKFSKKKCW